jgi:hypothetical protein
MIHPGQFKVTKPGIVEASKLEKQRTLAVRILKIGVLWPHHQEQRLDPQ